MVSQREKGQVAIEVLRKIAEAHGFSLRPQDEPEYLSTVRAAQESVEYVEQMKDYVDPGLIRDLNVDGQIARTYTLPSPSENPLNAWSHRTYIKAPSIADSPGLLTGKTIAIKDNVSVAGVPMTGGTQPFHLCKDKPAPIPEIDAPIMSRVLQAGAVVTGTSTCENYCMSAMSCTSATGPVDNPWLRGYSAGGSSSGSAALIAVNFMKNRGRTSGISVEHLGEGVDLATGGDQGGSIRVPASYCGIYGLKPTHGLVPYTGIASLFPILDHCGPMAPTVRDTALLLSVLAGYDGFDPRMTPEAPLRDSTPRYHDRLDEQVAARAAAGTWTPAAAARGLRVGILKEAFEIAGLDAEVAAVVRKAAGRFAALGAEVAEVSVPLHLAAPHIFTAATRGYMADHLLFGQGSSTSASLPFPFPGAAAAPALDQAWYETMTASNPLVVVALLSSELLRDRARYPEAVRDKAVRHAHELRAAYDEALARFDVLVLPATPTVAPRHAGADMGIAEKTEFFLANTLNTLPFNVTGHPGLVMPVGWGRAGDGGEDEAARLPVGMQIVGKRLDEETLFLAASAWEVGGLGLDEE
ncbi:amidase signature enzyme [Hypoxylon rubiginosum]|uniref:Amidase signature enzyme n=1 Tax=Hypoxylon rubiginosum TaxID=110542 RepID=A0ACB9ZAI0_9PEZI|nr:amidase signature enzyme [Hypoxylon rubiginosum]